MCFPTPGLFPLPAYHRIKRVDSFAELVATPFSDGVNALCWPRVLHGDFAEVVRLLNVGPGVNFLDDERLLSLPVSAAGRVASPRGWSAARARRRAGTPGSC